MSTPDTFFELYYGKYATVDLHNLSKEDARANLVYALETLDFDIKSLVVIHGYRSGTVIKNLVRREFDHSLVKEKVNIDAGRTIFLLKR